MTLDIIEKQDNKGTFYMMCLYNGENVQIDFRTISTLDEVYKTIGIWRRHYGAIFARFVAAG